MKSVKEACQLQPKALNISVADQVEKLDEIINNTNANDYFDKTFITHGMHELITQGIARLAGKSNNAIFHLKQAMGGGKTHTLITFGLLAKNPRLRQQKIADISHQQDFTTAKIVAFNGRNQPDHYLWGEIASQLGKAEQFKQYWEGGAKAPDETAWLKLFTGDEPILIMLDELPPYFHNYITSVVGQGSIADIITTAFANMLTAVQKKANICVVVSDLEAAYDTGSNLINKALKNATSELGRAEVAITPVNLESNEVYDILKTRLFKALPTTTEIRTIATEYAESLQLAVRSKTVTRTATAIADEIEKTYPFHPRFKSIIALFKENPKFKQTRGMIELVSRLLKSVWNSNEEVYLIGAQHFDLAINEVRDKLTEVSDMSDVIAKDLWNTNQEASAQLIDGDSQNHNCQQLATLLLTASSSTAVEAVKGTF